MLARRSTTAVPPQAYFVGSAVFHYLGPAFAVLLFARVAPLGVAWLRIMSAAVVFAIWRRPWLSLRGADGPTVRLVVALGVVLAVMNGCFYEAIARLPLGTVSAIEFLPVIVLAALGVRSLRNGLALVLAVAGVFALVTVELSGEPLGVAFAFGNAALFALYIVLAHRVSRAPGITGIDGLGGAMLIAAPVSTAIGGWAVVPHLLDPIAIGAGIGVGITSSVIPYVCDQLAMTRLPRATYSLMVSLLPATATVIGIVVLAQIPTARQVLGVALVVAAVALHRDRLQRPPHPDLVDVREQVPRVFVYPEGSRVDELLAAVAARQQPDPERPGALGREQVPDAVADDDAVADVDADQLGGGQEQVGVGLGVADLVAGHERRVRRQSEQVEPAPGVALNAAGGDRPRNLVGGQRRRAARRLRAAAGRCRSGAGTHPGAAWAALPPCPGPTRSRARARARS